MKRIVIIPFYNGQYNNKLFDIHDNLLNVNNALMPYFEIKKLFEENNDVIVDTINQNEDFSNADCVFFFQLNYRLLIKCIKSKVEKIIYFAWEPEVVDERHSKEKLKKMEHFFDAIMTWDDDLVDGVKYFKINYPYFFNTLPINYDPVEFENKKLIVNISGNKQSTHNKQLYTERLNVIKYYDEKGREDFELYGRGWKDDIKCFKGQCISKSAIYKQFKFALCLENMCEVNGYITEKIFDCFISGIVPIYYGADNIESYVPNNCYIDYKRFNNIDELDHFLSSMTYQEYIKYLEAINLFLNSDKTYMFTSEYFVKSLINILWKEKSVYQPNLFCLYYYYIMYVVYVVKTKAKKIFSSL